MAALKQVTFDLSDVITLNEKTYCRVLAFEEKSRLTPDAVLPKETAPLNVGIPLPPTFHPIKAPPPPKRRRRALTQGERKFRAMYNYRRWQEEDDDRLKVLVQEKVPYRVIAKRMKRTTSAVAWRARTLGLITPSPNKGKKKKEAALNATTSGPTQ